jgi:hypothetical protein
MGGKHGNSRKPWLYLLSSNARWRYFQDVLQVLALPRGFIGHFRYELRYIAPEVRGALPSRPKALPSHLQECSVLLCYLCQRETTPNQWKWLAVYPVRAAKLRRAYKTGENDSDVAHFYFVVQDYCRYGQNPDPIKTVGQLLRKVDPQVARPYVSQGEPPTLQFSSEPVSDESAFISTVEAFQTDHLFEGRIGGSTKKYYPAFVFISGLREQRKPAEQRGQVKHDERAKPIQPSVDAPGRMAGYRLTEATDYTLELSYHLLPPSPDLGSILTLTTNKGVFVTREKQEVNMGSRYDEQVWTLTSALTDHDVSSVVTVSTALKAPTGRLAMDTTVALPVWIRRNVWRRFGRSVLDILPQIGLVISTGAIGWAQIQGKAGPVTEVLIIGGFLMWLASALAAALLKVWW